MSIFKSKRHKETNQTDDGSLPLPLFGEGAVIVPPTQQPPQFGDELYETFVASMIETNVPRRFAVVAHDKKTHNSTVLAWGLDYGDEDVHIDSTRDDTRWHLSKPEDVLKYFPEPPEPDCLEIIWIDGQDGLVHWRRSSWGMKGMKQGVTTFVGFAQRGDDLIDSAVKAVRIAHGDAAKILTGSSNPDTHAAIASYFAAEQALTQASAHLATANYHARHYRDSV